MESDHTLAICIGTVAVIIFITIESIRFKSKLKHLYHYGYFGVFLGCFIGNVTPGTIALFTMLLSGRYYVAWIAGAVGALGALFGEFLIYNMGKLGNIILKDHSWFETAQQYIEKFGFLMIVFITAIPTPLYNIAAVISGMMNYPLLLFLTAAFLGQWFKYTLYALFGTGSKWIL
jgi:membrane protein YqaA with SNARE-associated domain